MPIHWQLATFEGSKSDRPTEACGFDGKNPTSSLQGVVPITISCSPYQALIDLIMKAESPDLHVA